MSLARFQQLGWKDRVNILRSAQEKVSFLSAWHHPLGFVHVRLKDNDDVKVRLHVWPSALDPALALFPEQIHNHSFDFISYVLNGEVLHTLYKTAKAAEGSLQICEVKTTQDGSMIVPTIDRCFAYPAPSRSIRANADYSMAAGEFHSAIGIQELTATLVFAAPQKTVKSLILSQGAATPLTKTPWRPIGTDQLVDWVSRILRTMESRAASHA